MEDFTNAQLGHLMQKGFKGIHDRQDKTNGNVGRNKEEIVSMREWKSKINGGMTIIKLLFLALIVPLVLHYLYTAF